MAPLLSLLSYSEVLQPLYRVLLPKIRVMRNFPTYMVTAYPAVGRLGLDSLEYEQTIEASNLFLSLYISLTLLSNLLRDSLELMQIESGLDSPVLEANYTEYRALVTRG